MHFTRQIEGGESSTDARFSSFPEIVLHEHSIPEQVEQVGDYINRICESFTSQGSGWLLDNVQSLTVNVASYEPIAASSYLPTPKFIASKHAVVNIQNYDNKCFLYSVLAALHPVPQHRERVSKYKSFVDELDMSNIEYPVPIEQISKFEKQNPTISIGVLTYDNDSHSIVPIYGTKHLQRKHHVNLLLLTDHDPKTNTPLRHYTLISNLGRLLFHTKAGGNTVYPCRYCLHRFTSPDILERHILDCGKKDAVALVFPRPYFSASERKREQEAEEFSKTLLSSLPDIRDVTPSERSLVEDLLEQYGDPDRKPSPPNILKFENVIKTFKQQFILYCDFESFIGEDADEVHEPSGFCILRVCVYPEYEEKAYTYSGENVMEEFYRVLVQIDSEVDEILNENVAMHPMSDDEIVAFESADVCYFCQQPFDRKCRHHDHVTGNFIAACCNKCNLQLKPRKWGGRNWNKKPRPASTDDGVEFETEVESEEKDEKFKYFIPVVFHNSKNYDMHHILKFLSKNSLCSNDDFHVIATNSEKFISVQIGNLRILDSCQFLPGSLDSLVENLKRDGENKFVHTRRHFEDPAKFRMILRKGVYPYEYMSSRDKFSESQLPPRESFYSKLTQSECSVEDYEHAQLVWKTFGLRNMQEYHDLYLLTDVLLLADVFESFREFSLKNYHLDPAHYYTSPGLSFDACLKMTRAKIELLADSDSLLFFESAIRGGVSMITHRYARANNPHLEHHDPLLPSSYLQYYDANNLYGWSMSQPLPTGNFKFLNFSDFCNIDFAKIPDDSETGYMLEVDLVYPPELHDLHNDLPLAPERISIPEDYLSPYQLELRQKLGIKHNSKFEKLVPNFLPKQRYVLHYRNLKYYREKGMILQKIHRVMSFTQSPWIKPYVDFNTLQRQNASSSSEKNFFKFMNNALFGKTMQNLRKQCDMKLTTSADKVRNLVAKPNFESFLHINEDLVALRMRPVRIVWNKPTFTGACILDLSKLHLFKFHYDVMKARYGNKAQLLFTDTDSLCYHIITDDLYDDMKGFADHMDTSNFPTNNPCYSLANDRKLGYFKDECAGEQPLEFVGLRSKMYSLLLRKSHKATAKGVQRSCMKKISHETFLNSLMQQHKTNVKFSSIRSKNHRLQTLTSTKDALNPYDDKRYILPDGFTTLTYGHYRIPLRLGQNSSESISPLS